jgi:RND family efflux transporter MFP subunit
MSISRILTLFIALAVLSGCDVRGESTATLIYQVVEAFTVSETEAFEIEREFSGVLRPAQRADLAFEFAGSMQAVLVNEGDPVSAGDLLAQLDISLLIIERRQLQAQLEEALANLRLTDANLARQSSLEIDGFASRQRRDELEANRDAINASVNNLRAALDGNTVKQEKSHLFAPFSGVISERYLEQGSTVGAGVPVLRILQSGQMEAHIGVPESLAKSIKPGETVTVIADDKRLQGTVLAVGAELKAQSHTAKVRIGLPSQQALAGSLVKLLLHDRIAAAGFRIPQSALTASLRGLWRLYVLVPAENGLYQVQSRDVQLRYLGEQEAYVEGGLVSGEQIIVSGVHKVVSGQLVRLAAGGVEH